MEHPPYKTLRRCSSEAIYEPSQAIHRHMTSHSTITRRRRRRSNPNPDPNRNSDPAPLSGTEERLRRPFRGANPSPNPNPSLTPTPGGGGLNNNTTLPLLRRCALPGHSARSARLPAGVAGLYPPNKLDPLRGSDRWRR